MSNKADFENEARFESTLPITVLIRPAGMEREDGGPDDWQVLDEGPGIFRIPAGNEVGVRYKSGDDRGLGALVAELEDLAPLRYLNLGENRKITDGGLARLAPLTRLEWLNLSSVDITSKGLAHLAVLPNLQVLDLSYCNRLTDEAVKPLRSLTRLRYLNLQACFKMTMSGMKRLERRGLTIFTGISKYATG